MIGETISHYKILEKLGEGGMGVVYKAEDIELHRTVALKFLSPQALGDEEDKIRFTHEAQAAAGLDHPNICTVYEISRAESRTFIAMAYVDGRSLREKIDSGPFKLEEALEAAVQVAQGLHEAHEKGIVHRDIKPGNIMITSKGQIKIMDFGVAKAPGRTALTKTGTTLGTVAYMSPEQARGESTDCRTDIWSLGVVLYEMVTGQRPFKGDYEPAVVYSILNETPEPLTALRTGVPMELERIVNKALAKNRDERYQHLDEMLTDLRLLKRGLEAGISRAKPGAASRSGRSRAALYGGIAVLAVLVGVVGVSIWRWHQERDSRGVPELGEEGEPAEVAQVALSQVTFSENLEEYPAFSPRGRQLAYSRETDGYKHIFVRELETGEDKQLTQGSFDDIQPAWSPDGGTILFVRSNQPSGKLEPWDVFGAYDGGDVWMVELETGKEQKIAEEAFNPSFSPDGRRLALDASWAGPRRIWVADRLGRNPQQVSSDPSEAVSHISPRWSRDGSRIVFQNVEKNEFDVKIVDLATGKMTWVTNDLYTDTNPVWSQSGDEIYFSSYRGGGMNIWRIPISSEGDPVGQPHQLTTGAGQDVHLAACPGAKRLAFSILKMNADIWRLPISPKTGMPAAEPEPVIATTREDSRGAWSPNGNHIAFNSDRTGDMNIWVYSFDDGSVRRITEGPGGDYQPNWSPDGTQIAFFSSRSGNADIWLVQLETGTLKQLTDDVSLDFNPFFSPDGRYIAFQSDRFGRRELWVMNADGTEQRQLTNIGVNGHFMRWSQDGKSIIFAPPGGVLGLYHVPATGGDPQPYREVAGGRHVSFSPDHSMAMDVVGHKTIWVTPLGTEEPRKTFEFDDPDIRIDYPVWSPDGNWVLIDRMKPQGGDIWLLENPN